MREFVRQPLDVVRLEIGAVLNAIIVRWRNSGVSHVLRYQEKVESEIKYAQ